MKRSVFIILAIFTTSPFTERAYCQGRISVDTIKKMMLTDWQHAREYTTDYMKVMPKDKYSFKAKDSIISFGRQLIRLAESNILFVSSVTGAKPTFTGSRSTGSTDTLSAESVVYYVDRSYDYAISEITKLPASSLIEPITLTTGQSATLSRLSWLMKALDEQVLQRARTNIYLRQAGIMVPEERTPGSKRLRRAFLGRLIRDGE